MNTYDTIKAHANGTTFLEISKKNFRPLLIVIPPQDIMRRFDQMVSPLYQEMLSLIRQSRTLNQTRDALLPRLLSGELRVGE